MDKKNLIIIAVVILIAIAGGAFYGGMIYGQNQKKNSNFPGQNSGISIRSNRAGGAGFNSGEIISKDDKSITIKLLNGGSKIIFFGATTEVGKFTTGTLADLQVGVNVMAQGSANSDGSVTATSIQIRPAGQIPQNLQK